MIDFPSNPNVGQTFPASGITYKFDGVAWRGQQPPSAGLMEAPNDGKLYARKSLAWALSNVSVDPFNLVDGTVAAPGLAFNSEPGLGFYRTGPLSIALAAGGGMGYAFSPGTTNNYFSIFPRSAPGNSQLTLFDQPNASANTTQLYLRNQTNQYILGESLVGTAAAKPLNINFPSAINLNGPIFLNNTVTINSPYILQFGGGGGQINLNASQAFPSISMGTGGNALVFPRSDSSMIYQLQGPTRNVMTVHGDASGTDFFGIVKAGEFDVTSAYGLVFRTNNFTEYIALGDPSYGSQFQMAFVHEAGVWAGIRFLVSGGQYQFSADGQARATIAGPWAALTSDVRVKDRIEDYTDGLDAILALRPRVFSFREGTGMDTTRRHINLIAQEALDAMPMLVQPSTVTKLGSIEHDDLLTLDIGPVTFALVNAVKTLHQRIAQLETP